MGTELFSKTKGADFGDREVAQKTTISAGKMSLDLGVGKGFEDSQWELVAKALKQERELLADALQSRYRLQIMFRGRERSTWKPMFGQLSFWEGAAAAYGGGDAKIYLCPECLKPLPNNASGGGLYACPVCSKAWKGEQVVGEILARNTVQNWARCILFYFQKLGMNVDLILRSQPVADIRVLSEQEQERDRGGEFIEPMRASRQPVVYPLKNIIKDLHNGGDLEKRILAFIKS